MSRHADTEVKYKSQIQISVPMSNHVDTEVKSVQHHPKNAWVDNPFSTAAVKNNNTRNDPSFIGLRNEHDWRLGGHRSQYNTSVKMSMSKQLDILKKKNTLSEKEEIQKQNITISLQDSLPGLAIDNDPGY
jgi:hypothetical protein